MWVTDAYYVWRVVVPLTGSLLCAKHTSTLPQVNNLGGMHTLCLVGNVLLLLLDVCSWCSFVCLCGIADIKVKEPDYEARVKGIERFLPPRFMTVNQALSQLKEVEERRGEGGKLPQNGVLGLALCCSCVDTNIAGGVCRVPDQFSSRTPCTLAWRVLGKRHSRLCPAQWKSCCRSTLARRCTLWSL